MLTCARANADVSRALVGETVCLSVSVLGGEQERVCEALVALPFPPSAPSRQRLAGLRPFLPAPLSFLAAMLPFMPATPLFIGAPPPVTAPPFPPKKLCMVPLPK
eukprot:2549532-Rhodomonas_salina.1